MVTLFLNCQKEGQVPVLEKPTNLWVTEAIDRLQNCPNIVLYGMFPQPYIQYPVRARAYVRSRLFPCNFYIKILTIKRVLYINKKVLIKCLHDSKLIHK